MMAAINFGAFLISASLLAAAAPFSHQLHIEKVKLKCEDCHTAVAQSAASSDSLLPAEKTCLRCHQLGAALKRALARPEPVPKRNFRFSHKQHREFLACGDCHKGVNRVSVATAANLPKMADCIACHNQIDPPDSCQLCHTKDAVLKPATHTPDWIDRHTAAKFDKATCAVCHGTKFTCMGCH